MADTANEGLLLIGQGRGILQPMVQPLSRQRMDRAGRIADQRQPRPGETPREAHAQREGDGPIFQAKGSQPMADPAAEHGREAGVAQPLFFL